MVVVLLTQTLTLTDLTGQFTKFDQVNKTRVLFRWPFAVCLLILGVDGLSSRLVAMRTW